MLSFAQELTRDADRRVVGFFWVALVVCDHCRAFVRLEGPALATPDALPPMRQLLRLRAMARGEGWAMATAAIPGDYCSKCLLLWRPATNETAPPRPRPLCENECGARVPPGRPRWCSDRCQQEAANDRKTLLAQNARSMPRGCVLCGETFRHDAPRGRIPQTCPRCRDRRSHERKK